MDSPAASVGAEAAAAGGTVAEGGAAGGASASGDVHLVSWNVAGWKTTIEHIRRFKGGLAAFLERHHVDILCLQEVKLSAKVIAAEGLKLGTDVPGFESFWACNEGAGVQRQGLNGVATIVRQGLALRADSKPLLDAELDGEGRCLATDHGPFVVFNVYVPNSAGGHRLPFKLRFLRALRAAMGRARAAGKAVILAGDLNMKARPRDSHWTFRPVEAPALRRLAAQGDAQGQHIPPDAREAAEAIAAAWPSVAESLRAKEHRPFETKNSRNGQTFRRWGVFAKAKSGDMVRLGPPFEDEGYAQAHFLVDGAGVEQSGQVVVGPEAAVATYQLQRPGVLSAADLAECLRRLQGVEIAPRALRAVADAFGGPGVAPAVREWLASALQQDGMADSFAELHPSAEERFTCWDQYKNKRHENVGSRIDYILVDRALFDRCARRGCDLDSRGRAEPDSPAAALAAATLGGLSQPSSFAGGGMPQLEEDEYFAQFRPQPGTGMLYTPPQLSDHIAVSLLLSGCPRPGAEAAARDAETLRCQPHRTAKRITDFFARKPSGSQPPPAKRVALGAAA